MKPTHVRKQVTTGVFQFCQLMSGRILKTVFLDKPFNLIRGSFNLSQTIHVLVPFTILSCDLISHSLHSAQELPGG